MTSKATEDRSTRSKTTVQTVCIRNQCDLPVCCVTAERLSQGSAVEAAAVMHTRKSQKLAGGQGLAGSESLHGGGKGWSEQAHELLCFRERRGWQCSPRRGGEQVALLSTVSAAALHHNPGQVQLWLLFSCSVVSDSFLTPWTVAYQAPLSMGFPSKITGVGCHFLLQEIFPSQGLNLHLLHCWHILYP